MAGMKRVSLDKLEAELEKWSGEIPLPCDVVTSMVAELRFHRSRETPVSGAEDCPVCGQFPCYEH